LNEHIHEYKRSGKIGPALIWVPFIGIIGSIILSFVYSYITVYSPIIGYLTLLFVVGFGIGLGFVLSVTGYLSKCRSTAFMMVMGFLISIFAIYSSWIFFVYTLMKKSGAFMPLALSMYFSPFEIWEFIQSLNAEGWYKVFDMIPSGTVLWIFWGIEALIIMGAAIFLSTTTIEASLFCERCSKWTDEIEPILLEFPDDKTVQQQLKEGDIKNLLTLNRVLPKQYPHLRLELLECKKCRETAGFRLKQVTLKIIEKKKKVETVEFSKIFTIPYTYFRKLKYLESKPLAEPLPDSTNPIEPPNQAR
jgi:hypothetical protein